MSFIPSFFVIQTSPSRPYLTSKTSGDLQWEGGFSSPGAKFAAEPSKSFGRGVVHIRSCFNNKYFVSHRDGQRLVITAKAEEPVEDTNDPGCTLFRPIEGWQFGPSGTLSLQTFAFALLNHQNSYLYENWGLAVSSNAQHFHVVDWETLVLLPSQVSFVSEDPKDHWAYSKVVSRSNYLRFDLGRDIGNLRVALELSPTLDASYRILNPYFSRFLRNNDWIVADADSNNSSSATKFSFLSLGGGVFALRSLSSNRFCSPNGGKVAYLRADHQTMTRQTRLRVLERVLERTISDIKYRFEDSRIHQVESLEVTHAFATNNTNTDDEMTLTFSIEESHTTTFRSSFSLTLGVKVQLRVTIIPVILKGKLEASAQVNFTQEWEETKTRTTKRTLTYKVKVPAQSRRKVTIVCKKAACDVPYSYTQRDLLPDGRWVNTTKDDGIFYGVNSFDFDVESSAVFEDAQGRMYV